MYIIVLYYTLGEPAQANELALGTELSRLERRLPSCLLPLYLYSYFASIFSLLFVEVALFTSCAGSSCGW